MKKLFLFISFVLSFSFLFCKNIPAYFSWQAELSEERVFIENKGQIPKKYNDGFGEVLFSASQQGINICWSKKGLTYAVTEKFWSEEAMEEIAKEHYKLEAYWERAELKYHYFHSEWLGSNPDPEIISEEPVSHYYTYSNTDNSKTGIKAPACKKIIYKNIYPNIDVEYILPEKGGIKYSFIVHPGADISLIKMRYSGTNKVNLNSNNEIEINTVNCGSYLEHRPETFYEDGTPVASGFSLQKGVISFNIPSYDKNKTLIIDPWITVVQFPTFYSSNPNYVTLSKRCYDVCYDYVGNAWVLGGDIWSALRVAKYNSAGSLQWTYQVPLAQSGPWGADDLVGDIEVNKQTGTLYVCQGANVWQSGSGAKIFKLNPFGIVQATYPGHANCSEISRLRLTCAGKLYGTGGGINSQGLYQIISVDTNLTNLTGVHVTTSPNGDHDANLMCLDPSGNYMYHNYNYPAPGSPDFLHNNELYKEPIPALTPSVWMNPGPIYHFVELNSIKYAQAPPYNNINTGRINMFNGMVCGNGFLYTYNGDTLKKWDKNTGAFLGEVKTNGKRYWTGGLDLDICEYVYAGVGNAVKVYDANLNLVNTIALSDTSCYDIKIDRINNLLYACGTGYVCAVAITLPQLQLTTTVTPAGCGGCNGTASANISCNTTAFNYIWSPGGQTTANITGLCAGTYTVIASSNISCAKTIGDTAIVTIPSVSGNPPSVAVNHTDASCNGNNGTGTATVTGGTSPYTYSWSPSGGTNATATGLNAGMYTVLITDAVGCTTSHTVTINSTGALSVMANNTTICAGQNATLTASGGTNYSWSTGATTSSITVTTSASASYTVFVTDANGCSGIATPSVLISPPPVAQANNVTVCVGQNATLTASGGGSYSWSNGSTNSSLQISPTANTTYTVVVSFGSCSDTTSAMVSVTPSPTVSLGNNQTICTGQNIILDAGNSGAAYLWNTGATTQTISISGAGTYWVFVALNNCSAQDTVSAFIAPAVQLSDSSLCTSSPIILDPGNGASSYLWSDGSTSQTISVETGGIYWVIAMFGNCLSSDSAKITGDGTDGTIYIPNAFTPNEDNLNEIFLAKGTGISLFGMSIFDRWGNLIFTSDDIDKGWDGKIQGGHYLLKGDGKEAAQQDVYIWKINYTTQCFPDMIKKEMGTVSIVK